MSQSVLGLAFSLYSSEISVSVCEVSCSETSFSLVRILCSTDLGIIYVFVRLRVSAAVVRYIDPWLMTSVRRCFMCNFGVGRHLL